MAALGLTACAPADTRLSIGGIDGFGTSQGPPPDPDGGTQLDDLSQSSGSHDLATGSTDLATGTNPPPDLAQGSSGSCSGTVSGGASSAITETAPKYVSAAKCYVVLDSGGLYAVSSVCTHSGCKLTFDTTQWYCNCHGATFDLNGGSPTSPAHTSLKHYALCVTSAGDIEIDPNTTVDASTRA